MTLHKFWYKIPLLTAGQNSESWFGADVVTSASKSLHLWITAYTFEMSSQLAHRPSWQKAPATLALATSYSIMQKQI